MKRLLLDFGGVVIRTPFEMRHRIGCPAWFGPFDPATDDLWRRMQGGEIAERTYWKTRAEEVFPDAVDPVGDLMGALFASVERIEAATAREVLDRHRVGIDVLVPRRADLAPKPAPAQLLEACRLLDAAPSTAVMVGDSSWDELAAGAAGSDFIGLTNGGPSEFSPDTATIPSLQALSWSLRNHRDQLKPGRGSVRFRDARRRGHYGGRRSALSIV